MSRKHSHYFKDVSNLSSIDVYRVLLLFSVTDPCIQHAAKKLLVAGGRGAGKDISRDIQEAIDSLARWQEIRLEDAPLLPTLRELPKLPSSEDLIDAIDPVDTAFDWFDHARSFVTDEWAFKTIVRMLLKGLECKLAPLAPVNPIRREDHP